jgi:hypothetical protein
MLIYIAIKLNAIKIKKFSIISFTLFCLSCGKEKTTIETIRGITEKQRL